MAENRVQVRRVISTPTPAHMELQRRRSEYQRRYGRAGIETHVLTNHDRDPVNWSPALMALISNHPDLRAVEAFCRNFYTF